MSRRLTLVAAVLLLSCAPEEGAGACAADTDCAADEVCRLLGDRGACTRTCTSTADCDAGETCGELCATPACPGCSGCGERVCVPLV